MYCNIIIIISNSISISIRNNITITISVKVNISVNITSTFSINIDINTTSLNWLDMAKSMIGPGFDKNILWKRRFFTRMEIIRSAAFFIHFRKANMKWQQICLNFWKRSRFSFLISKADKEAISWHQNMEIKSELDLALQKETWWDGPKHVWALESPSQWHGAEISRFTRIAFSLLSVTVSWLQR